MAFLEAVGVSKGFAVRRRWIPVIEAADLAVERGEFVAIVGFSGSGKSTLISLLAGLQRADRGAIKLDGCEVVSPGPERAVVFQSYALYPHKTVAENLAFPLRMSRIATTDIRTRVRDMARLLRIEELLERKPRQLSGGQQQRVALGRALIRRPHVFLLDEPLSNVDARLRVALRQELKALHQTVRTTLVYVTHDQEEAMVLSDRIAVMHAGNILQCAPPREIYARPASRTVAELLGNPPINILDVQVNGSAIVLPGGQEVPVPASPTNRLANLPPRFQLGIRPEHLSLSATPGFARVNVRQVEHLGRETHVLLDAKAYTLTVRTDADHVVQLGETIWWSWDWSHLLCFDPQSGALLSI